MRARGRSKVWITVSLMLIVLIFVILVASKTTLLEQLESWFKETAEVVDVDSMQDEHESSEAVAVGNMVVKIENEISTYAGVETISLVATSFAPVSKAFATVVDIRPMLLLKARHHQALTTLNVANVADRAAAAELTRLNKLAKATGSVATKNIHYAEVVWQEAKAKSQGLNFALQAIHDEAVQTWGEVITSWILTEDSMQWQRLLSHQDSLLLVTLPMDLSLGTDIGDIQITRDDSQQQKRKAEFVSHALTTDKVIQGETYFFKTAGEQLQTGMRLDAWLPQKTEPLMGVFIPEKAIVWSDGQAWAYVKLEDELYQRRPLFSGVITADGVFITDKIHAGETLVIRGAQMLLSEEFKWQIEDDD